MTNIVFKTETDDEVKFADVLELVFMQPLLMQYLVHPLLAAHGSPRSLGQSEASVRAETHSQRMSDNNSHGDTPLARSVGYKKKDPHRNRMAVRMMAYSTSQSSASAP